jgi:hypothetical protein
MAESLLTARELDGELPAIRLPGGAIRFRPEELEAWLADRATPQRGVLTTTPNAARPALGYGLLTTTTDEGD